MRPVSIKEIQRLDKIAIERIGIPAVVLMENAGRVVADLVEKKLGRKRNPLVSVVCGLGNNAGDGFVAARHLINRKVRTNIFLIGKTRQLKSDAAVNCQVLKRLRYPVKEIEKVDDAFLRTISRSEIVIDAIFGVGLNRLIGEPFKSVIEALNETAKHIVAVDVPSGLDATTGAIYGLCVKADETVTFTLPKKGFYTNEGPGYTGKVIVADIGIPLGLLMVNR